MKIRKKDKPIDWAKALKQSKKQEMHQDALRVKQIVDDLYFIFQKWGKSNHS